MLERTTVALPRAVSVRLELSQVGIFSVYIVCIYTLSLVMDSYLGRDLLSYIHNVTMLVF